ncbi:MAG: iron chaperone [Methanosarcina sp.]
MEKTTQKNTINNIDEYIAIFPKNVRDILEELRKVIRESAPEAEETISYGMPTFKLNGNLVHFAAHKNHIGFYPTPSAIVAFKKELSSYKQAKGSVQFPINEPIPFDIVKKIVEFRVKENEAKIKNKKYPQLRQNEL